MVKVPASVQSTPEMVVATNHGSANFVVTTLDDSNNEVDLLVNTIGNFAGIEAMNFDQGNGVASIKIQSDGTWQLKLVDIAQAPKFGASTSGRGDSVVEYMGSSGIATITNRGQGNFVVKTYPADGSSGDLLVNEIGNYNGRQPMPGGPVFLVITSDGSWSVGVSG